MRSKAESLLHTRVDRRPPALAGLLRPGHCQRGGHRAAGYGDQAEWLARGLLPTSAPRALARRAMLHQASDVARPRTQIRTPRV
jgi:hypothetical protein